MTRRTETAAQPFRRRGEPGRDIVAAVAALLWAIGSGIGLLFLPVAGTWRGEPGTGPGDFGRGNVRQTLVDLHGPDAALFLAVPIILCGIAVVVGGSKAGRIVRGVVAVVVLLYGFSLLGIAGLFYLPASLALWYAAARTPLSDPRTRD